MKIKTKLSINLYLFVCTIFVVMMALYWSHQEYNKMEESERLVGEMQKAIFERTSLRDEYLRYQEERAKIQWLKKSEYIVKLMDLASARFKDDMSKVILGEVHRKYEDTVTIFSKIVENRERDLNEKERGLSREFENRLFSQMLLKAYALSDAAQELRESNRRTSEIALKRLNSLTVIIVVTVMIVTLINLIWLNTLLRKRLEIIRRGTEIIGGGNLDYRIDLRSKDEFEDFSNELNAMGDKLKKSFVSIKNLEKEITERKRAEEALRRTEENFRRSLDDSPVGVRIVTTEGETIYANRAILDIYGYDSIEELRTTPVKKRYTPESYAEFQVRMEKRRQGVDDPSEYEGSIVRKNGEVRHLQVFRKEVLWNGGRQFQTIYQDITERKRAEEALRENEKRFKLAAESSSDLIYEWDMKERVDWFGKVDELLGYSPSEFPRTFEAWTNSVHPDDRDRVLAAVKNHLEKNKPYNIEYRVRKKDGTYNYWWGRGNAVHDEKGNPYRWVGAITDVTERKKAEEILGASEERYRTLFEGAAEGILVADIESRQFKYVNPATCRMLGYTAEELTRLSLADIHPKEALDYVVAEFEAQARGEKTLSFEIPCLRKDGSVIYTSVATAPVVIEGRKYNVGFFTDITERKKVEEKLLRAEENFRRSLDDSPVGVRIVTTEGETIYANRAILNIYGYDSIEELRTIPVKKRYTPESYAGFQIRKEKRGRCEYVPSEYEISIVRKNGEIRHLQVFRKEILWDGGRQFQTIYQDITERKRAEKEMAELQEQLRQSQRMEAIGQLAGGIAHDFNNLLTVIKGYNQLSLLEVKEDHPLRINMEAIGRASEKATGLIRQLLAFSRRQVMEKKVIDLNMLIADIDKMLRRVIGEDIELTIQLAEDLGRVKTDSGQIEQVILNLAVNARDAMPSGGKLTIETANKELDEEYAQRHVAVKPGRYVMFSVSDTGAGMTPEVRNRVFEPFFTTKEVGKGTGLGLSTVYGIVKQSEGNIWAYSEPGRGTTFKIYLPWVDEPLKEGSTRVLGEESPRGHETILIVEDEEEVRKLTVQILKRQGYAVFEASHGEEAMKVAQEHAEEGIDLLLTDVVMPEMSGRELTEKLGFLLPKIKVLYMSGYTDDAIVRHGVLEGGVNYLQKPFTLDSLARKVREVLDQ